MRLLVLFALICGCSPAPKPTPAPVLSKSESVLEKPEAESVLIVELRSELETKDELIANLREALAALPEPVAPPVPPEPEPEPAPTPAAVEQVSYTPTFTWPGSNTPQFVERLREHLRGENIHGHGDVESMSPVDLAFAHDKDHFIEYMRTGQKLPVPKDQRLADWLQASGPVVAIEGWTAGCPHCERAIAEYTPKALRDGIELIVNRVNPFRSAPRITIKRGRRSATVKGYVPYETMLRK